MKKGQAASEQFFTRTGSFATHASPTGRNLLINGDPEEMTDQQKLEALKLVVNQLNIALRDAKVAMKTARPGWAAKKLLQKYDADKARYIAVNAQLAELRARIKPDDEKLPLGEYIIEVMRERLSKREWEIIRDEAKRRYLAAQKE